MSTPTTSATTPTTVTTTTSSTTDLINGLVNFDIETPVIAAIEAATHDDDLDEEALQVEINDIEKMLAQFDALLDDIEDANNEDNADVGELNQILAEQSVRLAEFETFVDKMANKAAAEQQQMVTGGQPVQQ